MNTTRQYVVNVWGLVVSRWCISLSTSWASQAYTQCVEAKLRTNQWKTFWRSRLHKKKFQYNWLQKFWDLSQTKIVSIGYGSSIEKTKSIVPQKNIQFNVRTYQIEPWDIRSGIFATQSLFWFKTSTKSNTALVHISYIRLRQRDRVNLIP